MSDKRFDDCLIVFLCGLDAPFRQSIKASVLSVKSSIESEINVLNSQLAVVENQLLPFEAKLQIANDALENLRSNALVQLFDEFINCAAVGEMKGSLTEKVQKELTELTDFVDKYRRKFSVAARLQEEIDRLGEELDNLDRYLDEISNCERRLGNIT